MKENKIDQPPLIPEGNEKKDILKNLTPEEENLHPSHPSNQDYQELAEILIEEGQKKLSPGHEITPAKKVPKKIEGIIKETDERLLVPKKQITPKEKE
jgi:hypothetical protein